MIQVYSNNPTAVLADGDLPFTGFKSRKGCTTTLSNGGILSGIKILGKSFLDFFDFISNNILMPMVALITCILVGYVVKTKVVSDEVELNGKFKGKKLYEIVVKYIAPICIVAILVFSVLDVFFKLS